MRIIRSFSTAILTLSMLVLFGCASNEPTYQFDYDHGFNFGQLKHYRWYDDMVESRMADYRKYNSSDERVRELVGRELRKKGLAEANSGPGDFWINYNVSKTEQRIGNVGGYDRGFHGGAAVGTYGSGVSIGYSTGSSERIVKEGTAVLDVIDARTKQIIWRGVAEGRLKKNASQSDKARKRDEVAQALLADFPPANSSN